jgi:hypothetical protein
MIMWCPGPLAQLWLPSNMMQDSGYKVGDKTRRPEQISATISKRICGIAHHNALELQVHLAMIWMKPVGWKIQALRPWCRRKISSRTQEAGVPEQRRER